MTLAVVTVTITVYMGGLLFEELINYELSCYGARYFTGNVVVYLVLLKGNLLDEVG